MASSLDLLNVFASLLLIKHVQSFDPTLREPLMYAMQEHSPTPHVIGNILMDSDLSHEQSELEVELQFSINQKDGYNHYFDVSDNGTLQTTRDIDREEMCPMKVECIILLNIELMPIQYFQIIKVGVAILDINDNSPTFDQTTVFISLPESTPVGSMVPLPVASDLDSPVFGISTYKLEMLPTYNGSPSRDIFQLENNGDMQDILGEIYVKVINNLDHESQRQFLLRIIAEDNASPTPHQAFLLVNITITDINDNTPVFKHPKYTLEIPEDLPIGRTITKVQATDLDSGDHGYIYYGFSQRTKDMHGGIFGISQNTGEIFLRTKLDFETVSQYTLVVTASNVYPSSLTGEAVVNVTVTDANDNYPLVTITSLGTNASVIDIPENSPLNMPLAHISVQDPDSGLSGNVACSLNDSTFVLGQMYANDYMLKAADVLDHEKTSTVFLLLTCRDKGSTPLVTERVIRVHITDVNDNRPRFDKERYHITLTKDIYPDDIIFSKSALDPDSGLNGELEYSLKDDLSNRLFRVDRNTGLVFALVFVPMFAFRDINLTVLVRDKGDPPLSSSTYLTLLPMHEIGCFNSNGTVFSVKENTSDTMQIGRIAKSSPCQTSYFMLNKSDSEMFKIGEQSGNITYLGGLDYEESTCYSFTTTTIVSCDDKDTPQVQFDNFEVHILDVNDNPPVILNPTSANNALFVYASQPQDVKISQIKAKDQDTGENSRLTFTILNASQHPYLDLDPTSGELFVVDSLPEDSLSILITIRVQDHGTPPMKTETSLWIIQNSTVTNEPMVAADNLIKVLAIALPCGFIIVILAVLLVVIARRKLCRKETRNPVIPSVDIKLKLAESKSDPDAQIQTICDQLGYPKEKLQIIHEKQDSGYDSGEFGIVKDLEITKLNMEKQFPKAAQVPAVAPLSSHDSDSGCSADMSNSTAETWPANNWPLRQSSVRMKPAQLEYFGPPQGTSNDPQLYINSDQVRRYGHIAAHPGQDPGRSHRVSSGSSDDYNTTHSASTHPGPHDNHHRLGNTKTGPSVHRSRSLSTSESVHHKHSLKHSRGGPGQTQDYHSPDGGTKPSTINVFNRSVSYNGAAIGRLMANPSKPEIPSRSSKPKRVIYEAQV